MDGSISNSRQRPRRNVLRLFIVGLIVVFSTGLYVWQGYDSPDQQFPIDTEINISEGLTIRETVRLLEEQHAVRSSLYLYMELSRKFPHSFIQAGTYTFNKPLSSYAVAEAITKGMYRSPHVSVTLAEGFRARELKTYLPDQFVGFKDEELDEYDGTLFPDTYFFSSQDTAQDILKKLKDTFLAKLVTYKGRISESGFTTDEVIIFASIIEREALDRESKHMVSGILHKRLAMSMPLQVDAVFHYTLNKTSAELTETDLREDSSYNTYTRKGLPQKPISNPGLDSIEAVLEPTQTEFLYYLTDDDGKFYYAENFEEHKKNKERYLR